jgi:hypothetical protein
MEHNFYGLIVGFAIIILICIVPVVKVCKIIVNKKLEEKYKEVACKILPKQSSELFGYNGRVFSILSFRGNIISLGEIKDVGILVDAFKILDRKAYLNRTMQSGGLGYSYDLNCFVNDMEKFAISPENKGKYICFNRLSRSHSRPAFFNLGPDKIDNKSIFLVTL